MKKIFFFLLGLLSSYSLWAETVHVKTPGTLKELLMDMEFTGSQLTLTGTLNAADLSFIHDGKGRMENVEELDISQIKVQPSDESYANGSVSYGPGDQLEPTAYFYYSEEYSCDTSYVSSGLGFGHYVYKIHDKNLGGLFLGNTTYKKVVLPNWLGAIGEFMFQGSHVEECTFPDVYTEIKEGAFIDSKIASVKLPKDCKSIGTLAFFRSGLKSINLEHVTNLGASAFAYSKLEGDITIGSVETIPTECFEACQIASVKFSKGLKIIGKAAFASDKNVFVSLSFPEGVEKIYDEAFTGCDNLSTVEIPKTLKYIGYNAFPKNWVKTLQPEEGVYYIGNVAYAFAESAKSMSNLKFKDGTNLLSCNLYASNSYVKSSLVTVEIPSSVKQIGRERDYNSSYGVFQGCTALQTVVLHEGLESIGYRTFSYCTSLKNITLPNSLMYIDGYAFSNTGITSITLGEGLQDIGSDIFWKCQSLLTVRVNSVNLRECRSNLKDSPIEKVTFGPKVEYVPALLEGNTSVIKVVFEEDDANFVPLEIGNNAFKGCSSLCFYSLPARLTKIGEYAFYYGHLLMEQFSNNNITSIGRDAFAYAGGQLKDVKLGANLEECGYDAFSNITSLRNVYYDVPCIKGSDLFYKNNIVKVVIGPHVQVIPDGLFRDNYGLKSVTFEGLEATPERSSLEIGEACFEYCEIQGDVILPDVPTKIGRHAFYMNSFDSIHLGEGTYYIGSEALLGNNEYLDLPPTVDYIGYQALGRANVIVHSAKLPSSWSNSNIVYDSKLYVPKGTKQSYVSKYLGYKSDNIIEYGIDMNASEITIKPDEATQLTGLFLPDGVSLEDVPNITFVWESSDPSVATVDENGKVTAVGEGTATITAYASYHGGYSKSCLITVSASTNINHVNVEESIQVTANQGRLLISGARDNDIVNVYTMDGRNVVKTTDKVISHLTSGIYIVSIRNQRFKIKL